MSPRYRRVSQAAVATAVTLLIGGGAEGAAIQGGWDPAFGPNDPNIGWSGVANFTIPDPCLTGAFTGSGSVFVSNNSGCVMSFVDANVTLFSLANTSLTETLVYTSGSVNGMEIRDVGGSNAVVGIDTGLIGPALAGNPAIYSGPFWIFFRPDLVDPVFGQEGSCTTILTDGGALGAAPCTNTPDPNRISNPALLNITTCVGSAPCITVAAVPEPGTLGLILGSLGAGWLARRRRKVT